MIGLNELIVLFVVIILPVILILEIKALIDLLKNQFNGSDKLIWVIIVVFIPLIGSILYFAIGRKQKISKQ